MENSIEMKFCEEWREKLINDTVRSIFFAVLIGAFFIKNITKGNASTFHLVFEAVIVVGNVLMFFYSLIEVIKIKETNYIKIKGIELFIHRSKLMKDRIVSMDNVNEIKAEGKVIWIVDKCGKRFKIDIKAISYEDNIILKEYINKFIA